MAYFNHSFQKVFLGTGRTLSNVTVPAGVVSTDLGYLTTTGVPTYVLNQMSEYAKATFGPHESGYFGLFNAQGSNANLSSDLNNCCNVYVAGSAIYSNDKIGPFHGGYTETNKSKMINPKYVSHFYQVDPCQPQNHVVHIGNTPYTDDQALSLSINNVGAGIVDGTYTDVELCCLSCDGSPVGAVATITVFEGIVSAITLTEGGTGYVTGDTLEPCNALPFVNPADGGNTTPVFGVTAGQGANCCKEFFCGETYYLRIDIKGSPALRYLNHNAYLTVSAYTGCCPDGAIAPVATDSTLVMIEWAKQILRSPIINPFIAPVVVAESGTIYYAPGTPGAANTWDQYVSPGHVDGQCAGMILYGAYVDTRFGDCTFQVSDFYEKEPVRIYASEVDLNGDPCAFSGLCVVTECAPTQANGLGETVLRDLILSEKYRQNFLHSDFRIREITQGNQIVNVIDRAALYTRYYLVHSVPRFNNPSSTFDNDQYMLEFITTGTIAAFANAVTNWLEDCGQAICETNEYTCETSCTPVVTAPANLLMA